MREEEFVVWNFLRYRDPKQNPPVWRQVENAGWIGFFTGFFLGVLTVAILLN